MKKHETKPVRASLDRHMRPISVHCGGGYGMPLEYKRGWQAPGNKTPYPDVTEDVTGTGPDAEFRYTFRVPDSKPIEKISFMKQAEALECITDYPGLT